MRVVLFSAGVGGIMRSRFVVVALTALGVSFAGIGAISAADQVKIALSLKGHVFTPADFSVPAGKVVLLTVKNEDATPEEFDSHDLKVEKVIAGGSQAVIRLGPLEPGKYAYMGEYNE